MSRQHDYQKRKIAEGNCYICGKKRNRYKTLCDGCRKHRSELQRLRQQRKKSGLDSLATTSVPSE